jgi:hypothetical protein
MYLQLGCINVFHYLCFCPIVVTTVTCVRNSRDGFPCTGNFSQESAFHRPAASFPIQRCSLRNSPRWSSARYRGPEGPQQGLHTPVPVVLKYYTAPSKAVAATPPMCYRWKMFAENWSSLAPNRHSPDFVNPQVLGLLPMEDIILLISQSAGVDCKHNCVSENYKEL